MLVTASEVTASSSPNAPPIQVTSAAPYFDLFLLYSVIPQSPLWTQLSAPQGGDCPQAEVGALGADLVTFLSYCTLVPPVGQCLKTVASRGLSGFVCRGKGE